MGSANRASTAARFNRKCQRKHESPSRVRACFPPLADRRPQSRAAHPKGGPRRKEECGRGPFRLNPGGAWAGTFPPTNWGLSLGRDSSMSGRRTGCWLSRVPARRGSGDNTFRCSAAGSVSFLFAPSDPRQPDPARSNASESGGATGAPESPLTTPPQFPATAVGRANTKSVAPPRLNRPSCAASGVPASMVGLDPDEPITATYCMPSSM